MVERTVGRTLLVEKAEQWGIAARAATRRKHAIFMVDVDVDVIDGRFFQVSG